VHCLPGQRDASAQNENLHHQSQNDQTVNNMKAIPVLVTLIIFAGTASAAATEDTDTIEHGKQLHDEHCVKCHTDDVYTRKNRFVKSLQALNTQVERCKNNTGAPWFDEDTAAVVKYLDNKYYKF
jgi:mono/diheme cytochrome c family protein